jgi:hypothetical protein
LPFHKQIYWLNVAVWRACKKNIVLPVCFLGVTVIRLVFILFNTFLMLWVTSFVDSGVLKSESEAKTVIQNINVIAVIFIIMLFKPIGIFTDSYPAYITIPISFMVRALSIIWFLFLDKPNTYVSYFVVAVMFMGSLFENTTVDGLFNKHLPKDIRATLNSGYNFFGNVGLLIFTKLGGYLYDNVGPSTPFMVVAACDISFALFIILLRLCKKFND